MNADGRINFENRLWKAQDGRCAICGRPLIRDERFHDDTGWNLDHVYPRARYKRLGNRGNLVLTHIACNTAKADREPTGCEVIMLHAVNAHMRHELVMDRSYSDTVKGPSAIALALQKAAKRAPRMGERFTIVTKAA
ncbi:MAG: hypothetical protein ACR652_17660 [Methylocystis sp.]|uniref:hypothetical protein n=1 Tax=Methylocystis sp. TaxID=1911079 RepID=UPI003DA31AED